MPRETDLEASISEYFDKTPTSLQREYEGRPKSRESQPMSSGLHLFTGAVGQDHSCRRAFGDSNLNLESSIRLLPLNLHITKRSRNRAFRPFKVTDLRLDSNLLEPR